MRYSRNEKLVGKKIIRTSFTPEELMFMLENGDTLVYEAVGDCCSHSYIESIDDEDVLQNCTITSVEIVDGEQLTQVDEDGYEGTVQKWTFYKFTTDKGRATLSFRNDSNGYYNGDLQLIGEDD
jgi:hypothetical protein